MQLPCDRRCSLDKLQHRKRQSDARKFLTSGQYGGRQSDMTLKALGHAPPVFERGAQLASYENPGEDVTGTAQITARTAVKQVPRKWHS